MGLNASKVESKNTNKTFDYVSQEQIEAGSHAARLVQVVDVGVQPQNAFQGEEKPPVQQIRLTWQFEDEFMLDEEGNEVETMPKWETEQMPLYNIGAENAKSTKRWLALDPDKKYGGDFSKLLGAAAEITGNPYKKGKKDSNGNDNWGFGIKSATRLTSKKLAKLDDMVNPEKKLAFDLDEPDLEVFNKFPQWLQDIITSGLSFSDTPLYAMLNPNAEVIEDDDVPFSGDDEPDGNF